MVKTKAMSSKRHSGGSGAGSNRRPAPTNSNSSEGDNPSGSSNNNNTTQNAANSSASPSTSQTRREQTNSPPSNHSKSSTANSASSAVIPAIVVGGAAGGAAGGANGGANADVDIAHGAVLRSSPPDRAQQSPSKNQNSSRRGREPVEPELPNVEEANAARLEDAWPGPEDALNGPAHNAQNAGGNAAAGRNVPAAQAPQQLHPQAGDGIPYNWQSSKINVKDRLAYMFNSEVMADVHFVVGRGDNTQRIPAHKFVLSIGSAVFDAMFNGGMAVTVGEVTLPDVEPAAFLALLRFLYSDEVQIGPETVMTTLYTAKKYAVPALERSCVDFLKRNLSSDNAFMLLTQARLFDEPQLAALCLETIDKNTNEALAGQGFTDIDLNTLCVVLERDTLGIRECKLFSAVSRWAEAESIRQERPPTSENKRAVLGRAMSLLRFPLMTVEEFAVGAAQSAILSDREIVELFLHFTVNPKPAVSFLDTPRCCLTGKEQVISRFCQIESRWGYSGTSDRIRLMANRRIFIVGFGLYGSIHGPSEYHVSIQVIDTDSGKVCGQNDTSFQSDGSTSTFRVMFKEPVEIQPNTSYTACSTLKGPDSYYGTKGLRKVTHESLNSGKVTFQFTYAAGNNNGTSVEDGQLPEIIFYT